MTWLLIVSEPGCLPDNPPEEYEDALEAYQALESAVWRSLDGVGLMIIDGEYPAAVEAELNEAFVSIENGEECEVRAGGYVHELRYKEED